MAVLFCTICRSPISIRIATQDHLIEIKPKNILSVNGMRISILDQQGGAAQTDTMSAILGTTTMSLSDIVQPLFLSASRS